MKIFTLQILWSTMASNGDDRIQISIKGQDGRSMYFKLKSNARLSQVFKTYCQQRQLEYGTVNFYYDEHRVNGRQTPHQLEMAYGDHHEILAADVGHRVAILVISSQAICTSPGQRSDARFSDAPPSSLLLPSSSTHNLSFEA
ncbi:hypothetical protein L6164_012492 [Bauhinia variegata]|uniref:Uncharacterized protein n=1 Tax=Bauhinia variegata TaxID=167791 RepID=A0ACB9PD34_BAUVA|nr:hypothetical protein L6164_012492 [Bauhinia variegata]